MLGRYVHVHWDEEVHSGQVVFDAADGMHGVVPVSRNITSQFEIIWQVKVVLPAFVGPVVMIWVG